jgi:hypothetical protein
MKTKRYFLRIALAVFLLSVSLAARPSQAIIPDTRPPDKVVKLIFIHHSCGENWLADDNGGLARSLQENNYFVSDTNYGWGPDSIGDRTDILDWSEWFLGPNSPTYMNALYHENGINSPYERFLEDPGGENQIILFKSCFPNSELEGNPDDPPTQEEGLTVGHAKYIYNQLLTYFATRPDKLFVVITAPPVRSRAHAKNARAFNDWLVKDWLSENQYVYHNVAVFDFHAVLTGPDNHHRVVDNVIQHVTVAGMNTAYYVEWNDDHPSREGNLKATEEFVPLLNAFYHYWRGDAGKESVVTATPIPKATSVIPNVTNVSLIENFESEEPLPETQGWEIWSEAEEDVVHCAPDTSIAHEGHFSLKLDYNISEDSSATCTLSYDTPRNWQSEQGVAFFYHANQAGLPFEIDLYVDTEAGLQVYYANLISSQESVDDWQFVQLRWDNFRCVEWCDDPNSPFTDSDKISRIGFGINSYDLPEQVGTLWIDDLYTWIGDSTGSEPTPIPPTSQPTLPPSEPPAASPSSTPSLPCLGGFAPVGLVGAAWIWRKRHQILLGRKED